MSKRFLNNYFGEFVNREVALHDIEEKVTQVYGTGFFKYVYYEFQSAEDGRANLLIKLGEGAPGYFSASIHYDSDYSGSILIGGVFRNVLGNRSKLFGELVLGPNPRLKGYYTVSNGSKPSLGVELDMYDFEFSDYDKEERVNEINFSTINFSTFLMRSAGNVFNVRLGVQYELFRSKQALSLYPVISSYTKFKSYGNAFFSIRGDTRDRNYFPTSGFLLKAKALYVAPLSKSLLQDLFSNSLVFYLQYEQNIKLSDQVVLRPGLFIGGTLSENTPPVQHLFGAGGLNQINYIENLVPFAGVHFVQRLGQYAGIARMKIQYTFYPKFYFTLRTDIGDIEYYYTDMFNSRNMMFGLGGTLSYDSFIGPVELAVQGSNLNKVPILFVNIGFEF